MKIDDKAALLAATPLFGGLGEAARAELAERTSPRTYRGGQFVFFQGEPGDSLFVMVDGLVKVLVTSTEGDQMLLATLRPPEVFGELALVDGGPRSASVQAIRTTTVLTLGRATLLDVLTRHPPVTDALLRSIGALVRRLIEQAGDLVFLDLEGRVAKLVVKLAADRGQHGADGVVLDLNMTQGDLASMVGGSRQSVNQILHQLARRGQLELRGGSLILKDLAALRRRAGIGPA